MSSTLTNPSSAQTEDHQSLPYKVAYKWNNPKCRKHAGALPDMTGTWWVIATTAEEAIELAQAKFKKHFGNTGLVAHSFTIKEAPFS